jgi:mRNA-degrading endonuclease RelE of RelBE toxin-antitoxin system
MAWKALATPRYNRRRKKLSPEVRRRLTREEDKLLEHPYKGDRKRGALGDIWVEKFKAQNDQYLVAYLLDEKARAVTFLDIGQHENLYRDLEEHVKNR